MKKKKENVPLKAKICTIIAWLMALSAVAFGVYAGAPSCAIESIDNPLWGLIFIVWMSAVLVVLRWGYK